MQINSSSAFDAGEAKILAVKQKAERRENKVKQKNEAKIRKLEARIITAEKANDVLLHAQLMKEIDKLMGEMNTAHKNVSNIYDKLTALRVAKLDANAKIEAQHKKEVIKKALGTSLGLALIIIVLAFLAGWF